MASRRQSAPRIERTAVRARYALPLGLFLLATVGGYLSVWLLGPELAAPALGSEPEASAGQHLQHPTPAASLPAEPAAEPSHATPPAAPAPAQPTRRMLQPRDPQEWQGMRVVLNNPAFCNGEASCGQAKACIDGRCGPCTSSSQCARGEVCVLDHCLREELVACTARKDCAPDELCVLDAYSGGGTRNNERMKSYCLAGVGGVEQREGEHASAIGPPQGLRVPADSPRSALDLRALQREARRQAGDAPPAQSADSQVAP